MLIWAVDGGGTKTDGLLADGRGQVLARMRGEACNLSALGADRCQVHLEELLEGLCGQARVPRGQITHAFLALGGLDTEADREAYELVLRALFAGLPTAWQVENDVLAALYSGTLGEPGVALLAGTGSMVMALDVRGQIMRSGGWGYLFGSDPGSAFSVGERLLVRILRDWDAGRDGDELTQRALSEVGVSLPPHLVDWVEEDANPAKRVAQLSQVVDASAAGGYGPARQILVEAGTDLVETFRLLQPRLDFGDMVSVPVVLAGGMFESLVYRQAVQEAVGQIGPHWQAVLPDLPPVGGAYVGALGLAGLTASPEMIGQLGEGLR